MRRRHTRACFVAQNIVDICDDRGGVVERLHVSRKSVRSVQRRVR